MTTNPIPPGDHNKTEGIRNSDRYEKGLELAEAGKHQEALAYMQEQLRVTPDDAEVLNDTGAILHCLGRSNEAIDHILKARSIQSDSAEIVWNLAEAYLAIGRASEAMKLFDEMSLIGILNADILNRTADIFLNQQNKGDAIDMLLRSLQIWPDQEMLPPMIEVIRSKRSKVALFCNPESRSHLGDIDEFINKRFQVRTAENPTCEELRDLMNWSDISWFERCPELAVKGSENAEVCKNIIRVDRYRGHEQWPEQINWTDISALILIEGGFDRNALMRSIPDIEGRTSVVVMPQAVNIERFSLVEKQRGKNIAYLSNLSAKNNSAFILQCMQKLHYIDRDYRLFFGREFEDTTTERYMKHMVEALNIGDVVFFEGRPENIGSWLRDKDFIVSADISEHYGTELLEAMASGLKPVIHNFPGADQIFPSDFLFNISEEFCEQVCCDRYEPQRYRSFVSENYPYENQLDQINRILMQLEEEIESQQSASPAGYELQNFTPYKVDLSSEIAVPALDG